MSANDGAANEAGHQQTMDIDGETTVFEDLYCAGKFIRLRLVKEEGKADKEAYEQLGMIVASNCHKTGWGQRWSKLGKDQDCTVPPAVRDELMSNKLGFIPTRLRPTSFKDIWKSFKAWRSRRVKQLGREHPDAQELFDDGFCFPLYSEFEPVIDRIRESVYMITGDEDDVADMERFKLDQANADDSGIESSDSSEPSSEIGALLLVINVHLIIPHLQPFDIDCLLQADEEEQVDFEPSPPATPHKRATENDGQGDRLPFSSPTKPARDLRASSGESEKSQSPMSEKSGMHLSLEGSDFSEDSESETAAEVLPENLACAAF
jgi:hypothetical protein